MKSKLKPLIIILLGWVIVNDARAQEALYDQLQGKESLGEIMKEVRAYYAIHEDEEENDEEEEESGLMHWERWAQYMSGRLGEQGQFVNIPEMLMVGLKEKEKMETNLDRNINSAWTFVGPTSSVPINNSAEGNGLGRVDRVAFHPTDPNILYIGTPAGGLWNTTNGCTTWNNLTDHIPSLSISGIVISYDNPSTIYILTGDGDSNQSFSFISQFGYLRPSVGVLKSVDGGQSWHATCTLPGSPALYAGYKLVQSPTDPEVLFAATTKGLYHTTDGGDTWELEIGGPFYDVAFKPGDGNVVYATTNGIFFRSLNGGTTWLFDSVFDFYPGSCTNTGNPTIKRIQIGVSPNSPPKVYLVAGPVTLYNAFCGVFLSNDSGAHFTRQATTPDILGNADAGDDGNDQSWYDLEIAVRPTAATTIVIGASTIWRSENSGATLQHATSYFEDGIYPWIHPDIHEVIYNPLNSQLFAATDAGLYKSTDHGISWTYLAVNIPTSQLYHMDGYDGNANKLMGGFQDNGIKYRGSNTQAFDHLGGGDGFDVVLNPTNGEPGYSTINKSVYRYDNNGATSVYVGATGYTGEWYKTIAVHNTTPSTVLLGASDILKSTASGVGWVNKNASGSWCLTSCPSSNVRFYAAGDTAYLSGTGTLYYSGDTGDTWTAKSGNSGFPAQNHWNKITDIQVKPTLSATVYACFGGFFAGYKVVMSTNTGDTWTNISANLPNVPMNCLAIDGDNGVYVGTDIGVFYKSATMTNWMAWSNGLPYVPVTEVRIYDDGTIRRIRAATFGRGIWQSTLAESCDAAITLTGNVKGKRLYEASSTITSTSVVQGGIGTFVNYKSGDFITLNQGFEVKDESEFNGFISPCGQGEIPVAGEEDETSRETASSIIYLRRMYDPVDGLPFGTIVDIQFHDDQYNFKLNLKNKGHIELVITRPVQEGLTYLFQGNVEAGDKNVEADLSSLDPGPYYALLFYEGKLAHFQEVEKLRK